MVRNEQKQTIRREMLRQRAFLTPEERLQASLQLAIRLQAFLETHFPSENGAGSVVAAVGSVSASESAGSGSAVPAFHRKTLHIAVYAAMRNELDLAPCWAMLQNWPVVLYFPAVIKSSVVQSSGVKAADREAIADPARSDRLWFAPLPEYMKPADLLSPRTFGVPEPPPDACLAPEDLPPLDLILVPGLAFDRWGNRVGWGKAYYDGFLSSLRSSHQASLRSNQQANLPSPLYIGVCYDFQLLDQELPHDDYDQQLQGILTPGGWHAATAPPTQSTTRPPTA